MTEPQIILQTPRLILRPFTREDAPALHHAVYGDADVTRYLPGGAPRPLERVQGTVDYFIEHWQKYGYGGFAVIDRTTGEMIGQCGLNALPEDGTPEIFYAIAKSHWGQGITPEAAQAVMEYAFKTVGLAQVVAVAFPENKASRRVMEKIGMRYEGETTRYYNASLSFYTLQADDYHQHKQKKADSMQTDNSLKWWQSGVIYQIYPRSFKDSNGDGVGDLQGVIDQLDHLVDLRIDAIWISPFYPSPMVDFGYDVADYCDIHPLFGDLATFDRLVEAAHARNIKIIIDYVPNHSSDQHPWFLESRSSRDNPKRDWYIWRDAKPDGTPPNNWGSWFGGSAWQWDETTGQYYLHSFCVEQPDLNWANPEVYDAMTDVLHFWLKRGVDGFRMDVVYLIDKDPELRDNPINPNANPNLPANDIGGRQLHLYDRGNPGIFDYMKKFRRITDQYGDTVIVGEIWEFNLHEWVKYYGDENDGVQLPFNFRLMEVPRWDAALFRQSVDELEAAIPSFAQPNYVLSSHDKPRIVTRYGAEQARVAAMLLFTLRGTPTMYNGDEIGMRDGVITAEQVQDPQGKILGPERSRDGCRTPLQWSADAYAGFSTAETWLPVNPDYRTVNVAVQQYDSRSMFALYKSLIALRRAAPALHGGAYQSVDSPDGTYVYTRTGGGETYLIALNFTAEAKSVPLPTAGMLVLSTYLDRGSNVSGAVELRPNEGMVIKLS